MEHWIETSSHIECSAKILAPKPLRAPTRTAAFYNPRMSLNRDLSILTIAAYREGLKNKGIRICDAMTGVGVRGIRYIKELEYVSEVVLNDLNPIAIQFADYNVHLNRVSDKATVQREETNMMLSMNSVPNMRFDVVDLDPFGSPTPYLDSSIRAVKIGGMLAATATDMAVLCGVHALAARRKYGAHICQANYSHEIAIRVLIYAIIRSAAIQKIAALPVFCYYADHYVRACFELRMGDSGINGLLDKIGFVTHCSECNYRTTTTTLNQLEKICPRCSFKLNITGPLWIGPLFNKEYCYRMCNLLISTPLSQGKRVKKMLDVILEELDMPPLFYSSTRLCDRLNIPQPKRSEIIDRLRRSGFKASRSHIHGNAIKTDAPIEIMNNLLKD